MDRGQVIQKDRLTEHVDEWTGTRHTEGQADKNRFVHNYALLDDLVLGLIEHAYEWPVCSIAWFSARLEFCLESCHNVGVLLTNGCGFIFCKQRRGVFTVGVLSVAVARRSVKT